MARKQNTEMRSRILREAIDLFLKNGYQKTTMKSIASQCDISVPLLQHYYARKEIILVQYFHNILKEITEYELERLIANPSKYGDLSMGVHTCTQIHLFYHVLTRHDDQLLKIYSEILFNPELLMRGTDYALSQLRYLGNITPSAKERRGAHALNGILSQFVALYLRQGGIAEFEPMLDEALFCYLSFIGLHSADRKFVKEEVERLLTPQVKSAVEDLCSNMELRFIEDPFR